MLRSILFIITLLASLFIWACAVPTGPGSNRSLDQAIQHYNAQRFTQAHQQAVAIQAEAATGTREDAAYLAGLSAYRMGDLKEAEARLLTATRSPTIETTAKAKAMLGQVRMDQRRPRDAATYFVQAHPNLASEDAKQCAHNAAVAYQQAGDLNAAKQWAARSGNYQTSMSPTSKSTTSTRLSPPTRSTPKTSFTLQVGAFHEMSRAKQASDEAKKLAQRAGLGPVQTISKRDERGQSIYLVQFGTFPTREAAAAARTKIGKLQYIVAPQTAAP